MKSFISKSSLAEAEVKAFVEAVRKRGPSPLPFDEIVEVMKTTLQLAVERK